MLRRRKLYAISLAVVLTIVAVVLVKGFSDTSFTLALASPAPTKVCVPASVPVGGTTVCTITIHAPFFFGDTITDTTSGPGTSSILSCANATGGLSCTGDAAPARHAPGLASTMHTVFCENDTEAGCPAGSHFDLTITANAAGPLVETMMEMIGGYAEGPFHFSGEAVFVAPNTGSAPTEVCTSVAPPTPGSTACTLTLTSALAAGSVLEITIVSPFPSVFSACLPTIAAGQSSGITCNAIGANTVALTCPAGCPIGASVTPVITGLRGGTLVELATFPPPGGGTGPSFFFQPFPFVNWSGVPGPH